MHRFYTYPICLVSVEVSNHYTIAHTVTYIADNISNIEAGRKSNPQVNRPRKLTTNIARALIQINIFPRRRPLLFNTNATSAKTPIKVTKPSSGKYHHILWKAHAGEMNAMTTGARSPQIPPVIPKVKAILRVIFIFTFPTTQTVYVSQLPCQLSTLYFP